jgi:hypothetical protein
MGLDIYNFKTVPIAPFGIQSYIISQLNLHINHEQYFKTPAQSSFPY